MIYLLFPPFIPLFSCFFFFCSFPFFCSFLYLQSVLMEEDQLLKNQKNYYAVLGVSPLVFPLFSPFNSQSSPFHHFPNDHLHRQLKMRSELHSDNSRETFILINNLYKSKNLQIIVSLKLKLPIAFWVTPNWEKPMISMASKYFIRSLLSCHQLSFSCVLGSCNHRKWCWRISSGRRRISLILLSIILIFQIDIRTSGRYFKIHQSLRIWVSCWTEQLLLYWNRSREALESKATKEINKFVWPKCIPSKTANGFITGLSLYQ